MEMNVPLQLSQKLARAKSLLRRDDTVRGLEELLAGISLYDPRNSMGKVRFEVEVLLQECVMEVNRQPVVRKFFATLGQKENAYVPYVPGQEYKLKNTLQLVVKALNKDTEGKKAAVEEEHRQRRNILEQKGLEYMRTGDTPRGKAALRVLVDEYGADPAVLTQVGEWFLEYSLFFEAVEILEQAIENFPKQSKAYILAAQAYKQLHELDKMASVYLRAIKEFGRHPRTLLNLAKVYADMNKKEEAFYLAQEAWKKDDSLSEAKEIVDKYA